MADRLNKRLDGYLGSGQDEATSLHRVVFDAVQPDSEISDLELQQFLSQLRVAAIITDHMDDPSIAWIASLRRSR